MGRGSKPRINTTTVVQAVKTDTSTNQGLDVGTSEQKAQQNKCWEFELQNMTSVGRDVNNGIPVQGVPDGSLIIVLADDGALGYAPSTESALMLKAIKNSGSLVGEVLNNQNNSSVTIQLCLM